MSAIRDALAQYVAIRRALGTQFREPARTLGHFVDFLEREGAELISTNLALRWSMERKDVQRATWARRLTMARGFAAWLSAFDPRTEIPPKRLLHARHRRNNPYIFTDQEIERLITEAAQLPSSTGLRALTYATLIGLLAATGLRPGEALSLDLPDVDLQNGILAIRQTKFGKSRFVPIKNSTCAALTQYGSGVTNSVLVVRLNGSSSPSAARGFMAVQPVAHSPECPAPSVCERRREVAAPGADRGYRI